MVMYLDPSLQSKVTCVGLHPGPSWHLNTVLHLPGHGINTILGVVFLKQWSKLGVFFLLSRGRPWLGRDMQVS